MLAVLAVFLLVRKGRNATTNALALFAVGLAALYGASAVARDPSDSFAFAMLGVSLAVASAGFVLLAILVPTASPPRGCWSSPSRRCNDWPTGWRRKPCPCQ